MCYIRFDVALATALARAFPRLPSLTHLDLEDCGLNGQTFTRLSTAFISLTVLRELELLFNDIDFTD